MSKTEIQYKTIKERVAQFKLFYKRENETPLFGFFFGNEYPLKRYPASSGLQENKALIPGDFDVNEYVTDSQKIFEDHKQCGGDFIFSASAFWGIPWIEALLGCTIYANHNSGSIYSLPPDNFIDATSIKKFNPSDPWADKAKEYLEKLALISDGKWPLATTRMRGISDLLSALYGGERFLYEMLEEPDKIKDVCKRLTEFYIGFAEFQLQFIPEFHGGIGSFYYNCWVPSGTIWHQEDAAALLSPSLYEEFILKCDKEIVNAFNGCIMHQHSTGYVPTNHYIDMDMTALELHIDNGGPSAEELYSWHIEILDRKPLIIWGEMSEVDLDWIFKKLPVRGLGIIAVVNSKKQAQYLWRKYKL